MIYHLIAFVAGFILDLIIGDPYNFPHPVRAMGWLIGKLEEKLNSENYRKATRNGGVLVVVVVLCVAFVSSLVLGFSYRVHWILGVIIESIMTYQILATKCLKDESMKVYKHLKNSDVEGARSAVSMIVGRDTESLDDIGITKAAVETVAENTSDGVIAPMLYTAIGGPVFGFVYKAINTMDSMVGYKNDRYLYFGRRAARLDDMVNYLPSRLSALLMVLSCVFLGKDYSAKDAYMIFRRDGRKHASPNSAQTESACAGALGIKLAGDAVYFGKVHKKPFIGDDKREIEYEDIKRANALLYMTASLCLCICVVAMSIACLRVI